VLPTFAALLGAPLAPGTTLILTHAESLTALHAAPEGPAQIFTTPLPPASEDAAVNEAALAAAKAELIRTVGGSTIVIDLASLPVAQAAASDGEYTFVSGEITSRLSPPPPPPPSMSETKATSPSAAAPSRAMSSSGAWPSAVCSPSRSSEWANSPSLLAAPPGSNTRVAQFNAQKPTVEKIMNAQALATRIEDLSTKRLLPMEMISVVAAKIPGNIRFTRVVTDSKDLERVATYALTGNSGGDPLFQVRPRGPARSRRRRYHRPARRADHHLDPHDHLQTRRHRAGLAP